MFRRIVCLLLCVLLCVSLLPSVALAEGDDIFMLRPGGRLTGFNEAPEVLEIPAWLDDERVDFVEGFSGDPIKKLYIADGITAIGASAFMDCKELEEVFLPNSVLDIRSHAFEGCSALTSIKLPPELEVLLEGVFKDCSSLTEIKLSDGLEEIANELFSGCVSLKKASIPDSVTSIGFSAFENCKELTELSIPMSVRYISEDAFEGCDKLKILCEASSYAEYYAIAHSIPYESTKASDASLFSITADGAVSLKAGARVGATLIIPHTVDGIAVKSIAEEGFANLNRVQRIVVPEGVTALDTKAFYCCRQMQEICLPVSLTSIGDSAFQNCEALKVINLEKRVNSIGDSCFYNCGKLSEIKLPEGIEILPPYAFSSCSKLIEISLPESLEEIHHHAFEVCERLERVYFPSSMKYIGEAFQHCPSLKRVILPRELDTADGSLFSNCYRLEEVHIPASVKEFSSASFSSCPRFKKVYYAGSMDQWTELTGATKFSYTVRCMDGIYGASEEENAKVNKIVDIAATKFYTLALRADGTALKTTINGIATEYGWSDIKQITTTRFAICGLRKDGTVVAGTPETFSNRVGFEREIESWRGMKQIAIGNDLCVAIDAEGKLRTADIKGDMGYSGCVYAERAKSPKKIAAAMQSVLVLSKDGTLRKTGGGIYKHGGFWELAVTDVMDFVSNGYITAILKKDGSVIADNTSDNTELSELLATWKDVQKLYVGLSTIYALTSDGKVLCSQSDWKKGPEDWMRFKELYLSPLDDYPIGLTVDGMVVVSAKQSPFADAVDWAGMIKLAVSDDHLVGLRQDGTVLAVGKNEHGECNVEEMGFN